MLAHIIEKKEMEEKHTHGTDHSNCFIKVPLCSPIVTNAGQMVFTLDFEK